VATKTIENAQQEDTQRVSWVDDWDARSKTKKKKSKKSLPSMFENEVFLLVV
jgi:hypothetical protein